MKTLLARQVLALSLTLSMAAPVLAHEFTLGDLVIDHATSFATAPGAQTGAGYLTIINTGDTVQRLIGVVADFPAVQMHLSAEADGVMRMAQQDAIEIGANETVALAPGGYHIMFIGLGDDPFEVGEQIPATLEFDGLGTIEIVFTVEDRRDSSAEMDPDETDHDEMDHDGMGIDGMDHDEMGHGETGQGAMTDTEASQ